MITAAGMSPETVAGVGFGLLTFMGRVLLRESTAVRVHRSLQGLGSRGVPLIRSIGLQHLVLARVGVTEGPDGPRVDHGRDTRRSGLVARPVTHIGA
jgi:hypothetical protein